MPETYDCKIYKMMIKKKLFITLIILLSFGGHSVAQQFYDPYFREPLPATAPEWMRPIAENPSGVNFHEMQRLFNEWKAAYLLHLKAHMKIYSNIRHN